MQTVSQVAIFVFGVSAIWFVGRKESWRRWGFILGMCGQPFWIYTALSNGQYGMLLMSLFYAFTWGQGIWNYWVKKQPDVAKEQSPG